MEARVTQLMPAALHYAVLGLLCLLLLGMPLARGGAYPWAESLFCMTVALMAALLLAEWLWFKTVPVRPVGFEGFFAALAVYVLAIGGYHLVRGMQPFVLESLLVFWCYPALFYVVVFSVRSRGERRFVAYWIVGVAVLLVVIGLLKRFTELDMFWRYAHHAGYVAVSSSYGNRNHFAAHLGLVIPLIFGLLLFRTRSPASKIALGAVAVLLVITHLLTLSRGGWIALYVGLSLMVVLLLMHPRFGAKRMLLVIVGGVVVLVGATLCSTDFVQRLMTLVAAEESLDLGGRLVVWEGVAQMIGLAPLSGQGPGSFAVVFPQYIPPGSGSRFFFAHNDYLQAAAEWGVGIWLFVLAALVLFIRSAARCISGTSSQRYGMGMGVAIGMCALSIHSFVGFAVRVPAVATLVVVLVALVFGAAEPLNPKGRMSIPGRWSFDKNKNE